MGTIRKLNNRNLPAFHWEPFYYIRDVDIVPPAKISALVSASPSFKDNDGSSIHINVHVHSTYVMHLVTSPFLKNSTQERFDVFFFNITHTDSESFLSKTIDTMISAAASRAASSFSTDYSVVVGLDTESGDNREIELIQISTQDHCILLHKKSQLFQSSILWKLLSNSLPGFENKLVFCGADIVGDVLGLHSIKRTSKQFILGGVLDLSPIYSKWFPRNGAPSIAVNAVKYDQPIAFDNFIGLRKMCELVVASNWVKDRRVTVSDWRLVNLSPEQLKYAALDAWISWKLGQYAFYHLKHLGISRHIFSTNSMEYSEKLCEIHSLATAFSDIETAKAVSVSSAQKYDSRTVEFPCDQYASHMRLGSSVIIQIISPGGSNEGVTIKGEVSYSFGKVARVLLDSTIEKLPSFLESDLMIYLSLQYDLPLQLQKLWL